MTTTAVIVSRKGSVRIKNKAWAKLNSVSLIERKILQLIKVSKIDNIVIGTNDSEIKEIADKYSVTFIKREEQFCDEKSATPNEMIRNMLSYFDSDVVLWAHLTNPFINETHYQDTLEQFEKLDSDYDSLFSAVELKEHIWIDKTTPINHDPFSSKHIIAKDLNPVYKQNGGIFIRNKVDMQNDGRFIGNKPYMYVMNEVEGLDLDYYWQLETARALLNTGLVR